MRAGGMNEQKTFFPREEMTKECALLCTMYNLDLISFRDDSVFSVNTTEEKTEDEEFLQKIRLYIVSFNQDSAIRCFCIRIFGDEQNLSAQ